MIECPSGAIDYEETGTGATMVLVPGSCSTGAAWQPVVAHWNGAFRCVTTSLLGYGRTAERRTENDIGIALEAEIVESVTARAGGAVHLVGHSFGGLATLAVALRNRVPLLSLTIIEAPAPGILRQTGDRRHYAAFREMSDAYIGSFASGDKSAIARMIDFFGGAGTFATWPERVRRFACQTTPVNILDWETAYRFPLSPAILELVDVPTLVLCGGASHAAMRCANQRLAEGITGASIVTLSGAAHFMIATHPGEVACLIASHVTGAARAERDAPATSDWNPGP